LHPAQIPDWYSSPAHITPVFVFVFVYVDVVVVGVGGDGDGGGGGERGGLCIKP